MKPVIDIVNIVAKMNASGLKKHSFELNDPHCTVMVYKNSIIIAGTPRIAEAAKKVARLFGTRPHYTIQNIVASVDFGCKIDLDKLAENKDVVYSPEHFPAAVYKDGFCALVFATGKVIVTKNHSRAELFANVQKIGDMIGDAFY